MADILNKTTGEVEAVPDETIGAALGTGKYDLLKGTTVNVVNPNGELVSLPSEDINAAVKSGYKLPTPAEYQGFKDKKEYGEGFGNAAKAFAAGTARGASFGLSDVLATSTGAVDPETLRKLKEYQPEASIAGEMTGVIGSIALAPGAAPAALVGKGAQAVERAAVPLASRAARMLANPETAPIAAKVLETVGKVEARALGSAVEGAVYGIGNVISEAALGEPDLTAEKIAQTIGISALLDGTFGAGLKVAEMAIPATVSAITGRIGNKIKASAQGLDTARDVAIAQGLPVDEAAARNLGETINEMNIPEPQKKSILEGLTEQKVHAEDIKKAAADIGAPVLESQISASKHVQDLDSVLMKTPVTPTSIARYKLMSEGYEAARKAVNDAISTEQVLSQVEVGNAVKNNLLEKFNAQREPINELYTVVKNEFQALPVKERAIKTVANNIMKIEGVGVRKSSPEYIFAKKISNELRGLVDKDLDYLKQFTSSVANEVKGKPELRYVSGKIIEKLKNLEENSIVQFAEENMKTAKAKDRILSILDMRKEANVKYKEFMDKASELGAVIGKKKIYGPQDFLDFVDNMTPESITNKLFTKKNAEFLGWFKKTFPEEFDLLANYNKAELGIKNIKDNTLNPLAVVKDIDNKFGKEIKDLIFTQEQVRKMESARTWIESLPKDVNPSGTASALAYQRFMESPLKFVGQSISDAASLKAIQSVVNKTGQENTGLINVLINLEKKARQTTKTIQSGVKAVLDERPIKGAVTGFISSKVAAELVTDDKKYKDVTTKVKELSTDPYKFMNKLESATSPVYEYAPNLAAGLSAHLSRSAQFLASKLPPEPEKLPLSPDYEPSKSEKAEFARYWAVVEHPLSVINDIKAGTVSTQSIETLIQVYPKLYDDMKIEIVNQMTKKMAKGGASAIPYNVRLGLSMFLQSEMDNSFTTQSIAANQAALTKAQQEKRFQEQSINPTAKGVGKISVSDRMNTSMQKSLNRQFE